MLAVMTLGSGLSAYHFLYPRRPANTFGGVFHLSAAADLPPVGSDPFANIDGRFWLINNEDGPRAYYNICTHPWLGNPHQYRWDPEASRFQCPLCGSRFSREGHYQYGPAPRSLDQFVVEVVTGRKVFAETKRLGKEIIAPVVHSPEAKILIDTGKIIEGLASMDSPELRRNSLRVVPGELSA
jgi:cytochrome b6-f complex iron-sulfur subunit